MADRKDKAGALEQVLLDAHLNAVGLFLPANSGGAAGLGRIFVPDERDKNFVHRAARPKAGVRSRQWNAPRPLDQGGTPQCVGYSCSHYKLAGPVINKLDMSPEALYLAAQKVDEWPGENYDGTSVRAAFKVMKKQGLIKEYRWGQHLDEMVNHTLADGPFVAGTTWYEEMFTPYRGGFLYPGGEIVGGHAWAVIGANIDKPTPFGSKGAFRMLNSWGDRWGEKGRAWVAFEHFASLLADYGEAAIAIEMKHLDETS